VLFPGTIKLERLLPLPARKLAEYLDQDLLIPVLLLEQPLDFRIRYSH